MAGQPKAPFWLTVWAVILGLVALAAWRAGMLDQFGLGRPAGGRMCAVRATCMCHILRVAIAASHARLHAARATRPLPACYGWWRGVHRPPVCAASGVSRLQRAAHVTVPL